MTTKTLVLALAIAIIPSMGARAGTGYTLTCTNCGYQAEIAIGGGKDFEQITGFCVHSKKFVYLTWKHGTKRPEPAAEVWDSATGETIKVYKCPDQDCGKLFIPLREVRRRAEPGLDHCPKCGKQTLQSKMTSCYD